MPWAMRISSRFSSRAVRAVWTRSALTNSVCWVGGLTFNRFLWSRLGVGDVPKSLLPEPRPQGAVLRECFQSFLCRVQGEVEHLARQLLDHRPQQPAEADRYVARQRHGFAFDPQS